MKFNKDRFANFAKYDLTINKSFFRNIAIATLVGALGIAMLGFMLRYNIYRETVLNMAEWGAAPQPGDFAHYTFNYFTAAYEMGFAILMMAIFAGCWAHNLRSKQGRITELTLPATNLEKFLWHTLLMLVGGGLLCILSYLLADGFNALLTLMMFGAENGIGSLTQSAWETVTFSTGSTEFMPHIGMNGEVGLQEMNDTAYSFLHSVTFIILTSVMCKTLIFFFGNAVKYKYNIILTYIALQVLGTLFTVLFFVALAIFSDMADNVVDTGDGEQLIRNITMGLYATGTLLLILTATLAWKSYHLYTKAQITSTLNK